MRNLENLTIHQFRGLRDFSLQSLGQINLLVGVNNSEKTSVLEAISTYCRPLDPFWRKFIPRYPRKGNLYKRLDMPSIWFDDKLSVAVYVGEGSNLNQNLDDTAVLNAMGHIFSYKI